MRIYWRGLALAGFAALAGTAGGCDDMITEADHVTGLPVVVVDGVRYEAVGALPGQPEAVGDEYTRVVRRVDCDEAVWVTAENLNVAYCPSGEGTSNFLAAGTPIHRVVGRKVSEALTVEFDGRWELLTPL